MLQANYMLFVAYSVAFSEVLVLMSGCIKGIRAGQCSNDKEMERKSEVLTSIKRQAREEENE